MAATQQIRAILLLPVSVVVVVPLAIMYTTGMIGPGRTLPPPDAFPFPLLALVYAVAGLWLVIATIRQFASEGRGTLAPWNPPRELVITGIYRHCRNPMISGVALVLLAEATFFGSKPLLIWFLVFFGANAIYIPFVEERSLERRFGEAYREYKTFVPRWIPRVKAWEPPAGRGSDGPAT